ncbi:MAG TPA: hypothetical protein VMU32_02725 [Solirubrobacteraceae bacterium]|nr:hypothetical protein [Solirubrobacteraceae bacterium]
MILTRLLTRWQTPGPSPGRGADSSCPHPLAGETGDTLIEVLIAAVLIVMVVAATATGLNSANRATSNARERSQADALAQQNEEELRTRSINELSRLAEEKTTTKTAQEVVKGGTTYKIAERARYVADGTDTASCTSTSDKAEYIQTTSIVSWTSGGHTESVEEHGVVSPPPDAAVIVQVLGASGEPVPSMVVETHGPSSISTETSSDGCAILAISPGEYTVNVHRLGYVDQNGYENSDEDSISDSSFYVVAENTVKKSFEFAPAGELEVKFSTEGGKNTVKGDTFVAYNSELTALRAFGEVENYQSTVFSHSTSYNTNKTLFPFSSSSKYNYIVYAGTCEADMPLRNGQPNVEVEVEPNKSSEAVVAEAAIDTAVYEGTSSTPGTLITSGLTGKITDTGCGTTRKISGNTKGEMDLVNTSNALEPPDLPFGKYTLCVTGTDAGTQRTYTTEVNNDKEAGESVPIYLGEATAGGSC